MRKFTWLLALAIPVTIISCQKDAVHEGTNEGALVQGQSSTGNGSPSGSHFNLNIIGVENTKTFDYNEYEQQNTNGKGRRIFVPLNGHSKIMLQEGEFAVLDANGTDGIAAFRLPEPDAENGGTGDGYTDYSVYVRGLGKTGGNATMMSCTTEPAGSDLDGDGIYGETYCSTGNTVEISAHGNDNKFTNVSNELLFVWADVDGDGDLDRVELFDEDFETFYWDYENRGLRLAQLRFYPGVPTEIWPDPETL